MGIMTPVFPKAQDNPINLKIDTEIRIVTVYIWWGWSNLLLLAV